MFCVQKLNASEKKVLQLSLQDTVIIDAFHNQRNPYTSYTSMVSDRHAYRCYRRMGKSISPAYSCGKNSTLKQWLQLHII